MWNVNHRGDGIGRSLDEILGEASQVLLESGRAYRYGNEIVLEQTRDEHAALVPLAVEGRAESGVEAVLSNLMIVDCGNGQIAIQAGFPSRLARALLADEVLWRALPRIEFYSHRPVFDRDYGLCRPGYHADSRILVHGPAITPILHEPSTGPATPVIDRLPPGLGKLFADFCWRSEADLVNAVGYLLGGLLVNHFLEAPHPVALVDGNRENIGKTLVMQVVACVLDGFVPIPIDFARDEELAKRLGAELRDGRSTMLLFDNVRSRLASALVEANALSPVISFRILGQSAMIQRPNTYLWAVTSNGTEASPDLISRSLPLRLFFEGDPDRRDFLTDVIELAREHRLVILGELAGMVQRWVQRGRPPGRQRHRCRQWAAAIGGILDVAGVGEHFLANAVEAAGEMDESLRELAALAAYVVKHPECQDLLSGDPPDKVECGRQAAGWVEIFQQARVQQEKLDTASEHSRATVVGQFLGAKAGRPISIETEDGHLALTLCRRTERSRKKYYYFETGPSEGTDAISRPVQGEENSHVSSISSGAPGTEECTDSSGDAMPAACEGGSPGPADRAACDAIPGLRTWTGVRGGAIWS